jgi:Putative transposase of IS4/5 family (DUF4096)
MKIAQYSTDVTDAQWEIIEPMLPAAKRRGRPRTDLSRVVNAVLRVFKADSHDEVNGYDVARKFKGRKRRLLVYTLRLVVGMVVSSADDPECEGVGAVACGLIAPTRTERR